jgi:hypothetical protein
MNFIGLGLHLTAMQGFGIESTSTLENEAEREYALILTFASPRLQNYANGKLASKGRTAG